MCNPIFWNHLQDLDVLYEEYAKKYHLNYTSLIVLSQIYFLKDECTQKRISELVLLPKQTINSIIKSFIVQELVELKPSRDDRRNKLISLTKKGEGYCQTIFEELSKAEGIALESLKEEEQQIFLSCMEKYTKKMISILH